MLVHILYTFPAFRATCNRVLRRAGTLLALAVALAAYPAFAQIAVEFAVDNEPADLDSNLEGAFRTKSFSYYIHEETLKLEERDELERLVRVKELIEDSLPHTEEGIEIEWGYDGKKVYWVVNYPATDLGVQPEETPDPTRSDVNAGEEKVPTYWVVTKDGKLYRNDGKKLTAAENLSGSVVLQTALETPQRGPLPLETSEGTWYLLDGDAVEQVCSSKNGNFRVHAVEKGRNGFWLSGYYEDEQSGAQVLYWASGDGKATPAREYKFPTGAVINDIEEHNGKLWVATDQGAYMAKTCEKGGSGGEPSDSMRFTHIRDDLRVTTVILHMGQAWLRTQKEIHEVDETLFYRVDETVGMKVDMQATRYWLLPRNVWVAGVGRPRITYWDYQEGEPRKPPYECWDGEEQKLQSCEDHENHFSVTIEADPDTFRKACKNGEYSAPTRADVELKPGPVTIYVAVRDHWGNTLLLEDESLKPPQEEGEELDNESKEASGEEEEGIRIEGFVVPGPFLAAVLVALLWLGSLSVAILLAPHVKYFHDLLMNPYVRSYGSFGLFPLAMTLLPPVRRYILKRYLRAVRADQEFAQWRRRYVVPGESFEPEEFGKVLKGHRRVLLHGESGIGKTSYLKYLTTCCAAGGGRLGPIAAAPVFLASSDYADNPPEEAFHVQLSRYGQLRDRGLTTTLLQQGGFLIFIDGLNEVDKTARRSVHHFVEHYSGTNYFCLSSQLVDSDVETPKKVKLAKLSDDKVRELLRRKLGPEKAATALKQFSEATYDLCRVPQHLEFVVELLEREGTVPSSRSDLFSQMLAPVMHSWIEQDRKVFCEALTKRAYEMLCTVDPVFDRQGDMPAEIITSLRKLRFLLPRGDRLEFQHDTVRDFLAAKYFALHWETLLKREPDIDLSWLPMLEFVILGIDDFGQAKEMLLDILERNSQFAFAKGLYQFTKQNRPDLFEYLGRDFFPQYVARSMLEAAA